MAWLDVPVHLQDDVDNCGEACAQMVGRFLANAIAPQSQFTGLRATGPPWSTSPSDLESMINSVVAGQPYSVVADVEAAAVDAIVSSVNAGWPAAALIKGDDHWVVVHGVTTNAAGKVFLHLRNPAPDRTNYPNVPPLPPAPPPVLLPHADNDACASLNIVAAGGNAGTAQPGEAVDELYSISGFRRALFEPCQTAGNWFGDCVAVVVSPPPAQPVVHLIQHPPPVPWNTFLTPAQAVDAARSALNTSGVLNLEIWRKSIDAINGPLTRTLRVAAMDAAGPYVLVALTDAGGRGVIAGVEDITGEFLWARLNPGKALLASLTAASLAEALTPQPPQPHPPPAGRVVWRPCRESFFSPFFPFLEEPQAEGGPVYRRLVDGRQFSQLTLRGIRIVD